MKLKNCKPGVRVEVKPSPLHEWSGLRGVIARMGPADSIWPVAVDLDDGGHINFEPEELRRLTPMVPLTTKGKDVNDSTDCLILDRPVVDALNEVMLRYAPGDRRLTHVQSAIVALQEIAKILGIDGPDDIETLKGAM